MRILKLQIYLFTSFVFLFVFSCAKEDEQDEILIDNQNPVFTGIIDSANFYQDQFIPYIQLGTKFDFINMRYSGFDSVDIDLDGVTDFIFQYRYSYNSDSSFNFNDGSFFTIRSCNNFQFACSKKTFEVGLGQQYTTYNAYAFDFNTRMDNLDDWLFGADLWVIPPPNMFTKPHGNWFISDDEKYLPLRNNRSWDKKYGWLKIKVVNSTHMELVSYAIEL